MQVNSRYQRFVLWARRNNPLVNRLGQFAIWTLRTARSHRNVSVAFGAAVAALVVSGFLVSMPVATVLWLLAALMAGSLLLAVIIGFAGHLVQLEAGESELRFAELDRQLREQVAELDRQLREQESTNRESGARLRAELIARINASESRLVDDVQDLIVRMLEAKSELEDASQGVSSLNAPQKASRGRDRSRAPNKAARE